MARGQLAHPHGRTLGQIQSSTGDGQGRALMCTDSKTSRVVHHSHGCGIYAGLRWIISTPARKAAAIKY